MSHQIRMHDTQLTDDLVAFEAFCAGRSSVTTEIHQMLQDAANLDDIKQAEPPDSLHAHVTKRRQNMGTQDSEVNNATSNEPLPGNINRLLDRIQARK